MGMESSMLNSEVGVEQGWSSERVAHHVSSSGDRVVYVLPGDPPVYFSKVQEVVKVMEQEMGLSPGWLWHKQDCKVGISNLTLTN
jgi:N-acetyltransferase